MSKQTSLRRDFMTADQKLRMANRPRTHQTCKALTGVSRPGKTAQERAGKKKGSALVTEVKFAPIKKKAS